MQTSTWLRYHAAPAMPVASQRRGVCAVGMRSSLRYRPAAPLAHHTSGPLPVAPGPGPACQGATKSETDLLRAGPGLIRLART